MNSHTKWNTQPSNQTSPISHHHHHHTLVESVVKTSFCLVPRSVCSCHHMQGGWKHFLPSSVVISSLYYPQQHIPCFPHLSPHHVQHHFRNPWAFIPVVTPNWGVSVRCVYLKKVYGFWKGRGTWEYAIKTYMNSMWKRESLFFLEQTVMHKLSHRRACNWSMRDHTIHRCVLRHAL